MVELETKHARQVAFDDTPAKPLHNVELDVVLKQSA
jgi:hypothetical protein